MAQKRPTKCPTCKKMGDWFDGAFGPFCSQRCKLVDLGKWLNEEHTISGPVPENSDEIGKVSSSEPD